MYGRQAQNKWSHPKHFYYTRIKLTAIGFQGTVECWSCNIAIQHRQIPQCQDLTFHCQVNIKEKQSAKKCNFKSKSINIQISNHPTAVSFIETRAWHIVDLACILKITSEHLICIMQIRWDCSNK